MEGEKVFYPVRNIVRQAPEVNRVAKLARGDIDEVLPHPNSLGLLVLPLGVLLIRGFIKGHPQV
jgi:hypothetical protein